MLAALPLLLGGLAGCASQQGSSNDSGDAENVLDARGEGTPSGSSTSPEVVKDAQYESAEELARAYRAAGGAHCAESAGSHERTYASSVYSCEEDAVLSTYNRHTDRIGQVMSAAEESSKTPGEDDALWLVGETWIIEAPDAEQVQDELGGKIVDFSEIEDR